MGLRSWREWDNRKGKKLLFVGELENAKCKMQNAKLMRPFACVKAYFMVIFCMWIPEKHLPTKVFSNESSLSFHSPVL